MDSRAFGGLRLVHGRIHPTAWKPCSRELVGFAPLIDTSYMLNVLDWWHEAVLKMP